MEKDPGVVAGGFVFVSVTGLLACWWAYKEALLEFRDVRVWLACHELCARRACMEKGRVPRFTVDEVSRLVGGVGGEHVQASLRRLTTASLLRWSEPSIGLSPTLDSLPPEAQAFIESVQNHRRKIPFPRRLLRFLAASRKPVLLATALGHVLRCLYYRRGQCSPSGLCKASWIAMVFGVDERNVKAARHNLESLGVLIREPTTQLRMNRYGLTVRLNLAWSPPSASRETPPRAALSTTESPRPRETGTSSFGRSENQKLRAPNRTGVRKRTGRGPSLSRVAHEDLTDKSRLCRLLEQAQARGWVGRSEAERLKFFAAAEHACRFARTTVEGLFVSVVKRGLWHHLTLSDEDDARRAMSALPTRASTLNKLRPRALSAPDNEPIESIRERVRRSLASVGVVND
jgi:hypothetical protein